MSLDEIYTKYAGQSLSFDKIEANRGQCVQWIEFVHTELYGHPPHYANAIDWYNNPKELLNYYDKIPAGQLPLKGDIAVWGTGVGSIYGHIGVVMQNGTAVGFLGADSNWGGNKTVHLVNHNYTNIIGYLRPKGAAMFEGKTAEQWAKEAKFNASVAKTREDYLTRISIAAGDDADAVEEDDVVRIIQKIDEKNKRIVALESQLTTQYVPVSEQLFREKK